jgi:hypothetical protein
MERSQLDGWYPIGAPISQADRLGADRMVPLAAFPRLETPGFNFQFFTLKGLHMARSRVPMAKAIATGRVLHDRKRFANRKEPESTGPLGPPPAWLKTPAADAWESFSDELPWLNRSHRCLTAIASIARAELATGCADTRMLTLLRQCLGSMGATPADVSKITMPGGEETAIDPADKYFA